MPAARAAEAGGAFDRWMREVSLPFWASTGRCRSGGFVEHLGPAGEEADPPFKRMRVQARQIYVFSQAELLGWPGGLAAATAGMEFILAHGRAEGGAWVRRLGRGGGVLDPAIDLYDQAFVLFALAWFARASGSDEPVAMARRTLGWIVAHMSTGEGFHNVVPVEPGWRQQNPHMHLLEATLALYEASGEAEFAEQALALLALFRARLFDPRTGTLGEFFGADWSAAPGEAGNHVEPGHHFEWAWLLDRAAARLGVATGAEAEALYRFALAHGVDPATGLVRDVLARDGTVRDAGTRLWPQTEAIKAHAVHPEGAAHLAPAVGRLMERFLVQPGDPHRPAGTWVDQRDANGLARIDRVPASSLYHIAMAWGELAG